MRLCNMLMSKVCQDADGATVSFIDRGVYTKNRAFRLMLSSKAGKDTVLQITGDPLSLQNCLLISVGFASAN